MSVVIATAYMEEAERFDLLLAMNDGKILAASAPADSRRGRTAANVEDAFIALLPEELRAEHQDARKSRRTATSIASR